MFAGCCFHEMIPCCYMYGLHASRVLPRFMLMLVVPSSCRQTVEMSPCLYVHRELLRRERYLIRSLCFNVFLSSMKSNCCNFSTSNPFIYGDLIDFVGSDTLMAFFRFLLVFRSLDENAVNSTFFSPMYRLCSRMSLNGRC